jgi:hypothetical protein
MQQVSAAELERIAPLFTVTHQVTGALQPLCLTPGQRAVLEAIERHERVVVLKGRQVYISTACCLYALLFAIVNPGVKVALVADTRDKAEGLLAKVTGWARRAQAVGNANTRRLTLKNGAEVHAITANSGDVGSDEVKAGRSFSYGLIILSEFAYYTRDAALLASLTRSALAGARIVIETTATPAENAFRSIWDKGQGWEHVFLSFEQHAAYQRDPAELTDEMWADLQGRHGFSSRAHAAYWWRMVTVDMNGDVHRGLREAPIVPDHAFSFAEGRWIFGYEEATPIRTAGGWHYYAEPDDSGVILGVDTASGLGADASAIAVVSRSTGQKLATYVDNTIKVPDFITLAKAAVMRWQPFATVVESNGIGSGVFQALELVPQARAMEHRSHESEKPQRMQMVKVAIESGQVAAGPELVHEIKHSVMLKPRRSGGGPIWDGPDDLLNALGFALVFRAAHPWRAAAPAINPRTHVDRRSVRAAKRKRVM